MEEQKLQQLYDALKNEPLIQKYIYNGTWLSGESTLIHPIEFWKAEVSVQLNTHKNVFERFIDRFVEQHNDLVISGSFVRNDGSCPPELIFDYNIPENKNYPKGRAINKAYKAFWAKNKKKLLTEAATIEEFLTAAEDGLNAAYSGLTTFAEQENAYSTIDIWKKRHPLTESDYQYAIQKYGLDREWIDW